MLDLLLFNNIRLFFLNRVINIINISGCFELNEVILIAELCFSIIIFWLLIIIFFGLKFNFYLFFNYNYLILFLFMKNN